MRAALIIGSVTAGFLLGTAFGSFFGSVLQHAFLFSAVALVAALVFLRRELLLLSLFFFISFLFGGVRAAEEVEHWQSLRLHESAFAGTVRVIGFPERKDTYQEVGLETVSCSPGRTCPEERILWRTNLSESVAFGDRFLFACVLELPENRSETFDYRFFLARRGIGFLCPKGERQEILPPDPTGRFFGALSFFRVATEQVLREALPEPEAGLAKGLLLGGSSYMDARNEGFFERIGMTHIVAVSGYNIMLVAELCLFLGLSSGLWRRQALIFVAVGIWLFVMLVGAPASALRAGIMAFGVFMAIHQGRIARPFFLLGLAAAAMLLSNPLLLRYDIGFQLSFLALAGILFGARPGEGTGEGFSGATIREVFRMTLFVELFVLPLIAYHFGLLSWFSLIANIVLLPLVPFAMAGSLSVCFFGGAFPVATPLFSWVAYVPLSLITRFAEFFGSRAMIAFELPPFPFAFLLIWYALLVTFCLARLRERKRLWYAEAFLVAPRRASFGSPLQSPLAPFWETCRAWKDRHRLS